MRGQAACGPCGEVAGGTCFAALEGRPRQKQEGSPVCFCSPVPLHPDPHPPPCPFPCLSHLPRSLAARSRHGSRSQGRPCPARPEEAAGHTCFLVSLSGWAAGERVGGRWGARWGPPGSGLVAVELVWGSGFPWDRTRTPEAPQVCYTPSGSGCSGLPPWALGFLCQLRKLTQCIPKPLLAGATNSPILTEAGPLLLPGEAWIPPSEGP